MTKKLLRISIFVIFVFIFVIISINIRFHFPNSKNNTKIDISFNQTKDILYFAYGSNMNINQMNNRCPNGFEKYINNVLSDYVLGFDQSGYANIKEQEESYVPGVVYKISKECLKSLDSYEGYPNHYNRLIVSLYDFSTRTALKSWVYIQPPENFGGVPNKSYLNIIIAGAEENKLYSNWINYLKEYTPSLNWTEYVRNNK